MFDRTGVAAYLAIMTSCLAGIFHLSSWAIVFAACALMLLSILKKHDAAMSRLGTSGTVQVVVMASSAVNAGMVSVTSYVMGTSIDLIFGIG